MIQDEIYMQRCIDLAALGTDVAPNPKVGAVIVFKGRIIGEGYHRKFGEAHAEVHAIASVKNKEDLKNSTLYVNLEPCAHHGKTPPCADLIISTGIPKVVIGTPDPFDAVNGSGIQKLKDAGIQVSVNVLTDACLKLNSRFFTFHLEKRPYITLKWAQSIDAYIDVERLNNEKGVFWITQPETKALVHKWRSQEGAILVGTNTVRNDNPSLTVREVAGKNPTRVIIDRYLKLPKNAKVFSADAPTLVLTEKSKENDRHVSYLQVANWEHLPSQISAALYQKGIQSVMIEGGAYTLQSFIDAGLWDEARVLVGKKILNSGLAAPFLNLLPYRKENYGEDRIFYYKPL